MTSLVAMALLGVLKLISIAITVARAATVRARAAGAALSACEEKARKSAELARKMEAGNRHAGDAAHDLNDLLTAIAGHSELLIASLDPSSDNLQDAREIQRAAFSAARLIKPLRMLNGGQRASTDVTDVNVVTARTVASLERMLGSTIEVTLALDNDVTRVKIGSSQLEEIVLNLGLHARDAMPKGGRLTVATAMHTDERHAASDSPPEYVRMIIADTGGGMSAAARSKLFEPFFASDGAGGSAIGLAKVAAIVKQAGGRIQVESASGGGTAFTIDLPATSEPATAAADAFVNAPAIAPVLVVEDDPRVLELIRLVLVRAGHAVVAVAGPYAALAELNRDPTISLMLVDVVMPQMDGYDLMIEARKIAAAVQVVFISGFARDETRHPSGDRFLAKPFTVESLTGIVQQALAAN